MTDDSNRMDCRIMGDNHSEDMHEIWHGHTSPARLCGHHASQRPDLGQVRRAAGTL